MNAEIGSAVQSIVRKTLMLMNVSRKRRSIDCKKNSDADECKGRKRRSVDCKKNSDADECKDIKRRSVDCDKNPDECKERKRRSVDCEETPNVQECLNKQRRSVSSACEACENNPDSTECNDCLGPK